MTHGVLDQIEQYLTAKAHGGAGVKKLAVGVLGFEEVARIATTRLPSYATWHPSDDLIVTRASSSPRGLDVYRFDRSAGMITRVAELATSALAQGAMLDWNPSYPDRFITTAIDSTARLSIFQVNEGAGTITEVGFYNPGNSVWDAGWNADGDRIALIWANSPYLRVISYNPTTHATALVASLTASDGRACKFSNTGSTILVGHTANPHIRVVAFNKGAGSLTQLAGHAHRDTSDVRWRSDDLAFISTFSAVTNSDHPPRIWEIDKATGAVSLLAQILIDVPPAAGARWLDSGHAVIRSGAGTSLSPAYVSALPCVDGEAVMFPSGTSPFSATSTIGALAASYDGQYIAYREGSDLVVCMRIDGPTEIEFKKTAFAVGVKRRLA